MHIVNAAGSKLGSFFGMSRCSWRSLFVKSIGFHCCPGLLRFSIMRRVCLALSFLTTFSIFSSKSLCLFQSYPAPSARPLRYCCLRCFSSLSRSPTILELCNFFGLPVLFFSTIPAVFPWRCRRSAVESRRLQNPLQPVSTFWVQFWKTLWHPFYYWGYSAGFLVYVNCSHALCPCELPTLSYTPEGGRCLLNWEELFS